MGKELTEWLIEVRGLDPELAARMGWRQARTKAGDPAVTIPYIVRGEERWRKARRIDGEKQFFAFPSGVEHDLWNVDVLHDQTLAEHPVILTEGECDALACIQAGFVRSVSIPDGWTETMVRTETGTDKARPLMQNEKALRDAPKVIVAGDNDNPGRALSRFMANFLDGCDVRACRWPDGCKDANDVLREHGVAALVRCVEAAEKVDPDGGRITGLVDLPPLPDRVIWRAGHSEVDRVAAFEAGALSVLTGIPGHGKTTWAIWVMNRLVRQHNLRVGLMTFETHAHRVRDQIVRMNSTVDLQFMGEKEYRDAVAAADENWKIVTRHHHDNTAHELKWLKTMIRSLAMREACNVILVDPWNELEHFPEPGESMTQYTNVALAAIRQWAEQFGVHIMLTAHPRKIGPDLTRPPGGYDIADSAAWYNKPSLGLTIYQDEDENDQPFVKLINWKTRERELYGIKPAEARLVFENNRFSYRAYQRAARMDKPNKTDAA